MQKRIMLIILISVVLITGLILFFNALVKSAVNERTTFFTLPSNSIEEKAPMTESRKGEILVGYLILRNIGYFKAR